LILVFALASSFLTKAQQEQSPLPVSSTEPTAGNRAAQLAPTSGQELPDAPRRPPLQTRRKSFAERFQLYRHSIVNPDSILSTAFGASLAQASDEPPEWGQGASGFGTRLASGYGRLVISRTIRFGVATIDHEDPRFTPSNEVGFWRRSRHASVYYVMSRTDGG